MNPPAWPVTDGMSAVTAVLGTYDGRAPARPVLLLEPLFAAPPLPQALSSGAMAAAPATVTAVLRRVLRLIWVLMSVRPFIVEDPVCRIASMLR